MRPLNICKQSLERLSAIEAKILARTSLGEEIIDLVFWSLFHFEDLHSLNDFSKSV